MEFSFAAPADTEAVRMLWDICFGDEKRYMDIFFSHMYSPDNTCIARDGGNVVSSLQMFPHTFCINGKTYSGMYIGGVDTLPAYRGRGIATRLIAFAEEEMKKQNIDISFLVPVSSSFYYKMGYRPVSYLSEVSGPMSALASFSQADITSARQTFSSPHAYEVFARQFPLYLRRDERRFSDEILPLSEALCYSLPEDAGYILFSVQNDVLTGWECAYKDEAVLRRILSLLHMRHGNMKSFRLRLPADGTARKILFDTTVTETRRLHAMAKPLSKVTIPHRMENYINMIGWF